MPRNPDAWVIDASVAAKWYLRDEEFTDVADYFQRLTASPTAAVMAPHLSRHEVANALATACRAGRKTWMDAAANVQSFVATGLSLETDPAWLLEAAMRKAVDFRIAIHDAVYLALAERTHASLITADKKLRDLVRKELDFVFWAGEFQSP